MPPRRRPQFTQETIDQQLQQIHLLDQSSSSENLEQLGPIIKQIYANRQQDAYLRAVGQLIQTKDAEIETICGDNYQEFISSVSTLFSVKSYTTNLRDKIQTLDAGVEQVGRGLVEKKRALLQTKKTTSNLDEAVETLQACLRVLDVVNRVGEMIKEGKYWSALRSLEDIESMPATSLSQTPLFQHLLSSLPSLRSQIKDAVSASMKQWLLDIRNVSAQVGQLALESMEHRVRKWRQRREKDPLLKLSRVGSAVEIATNEKTEFNVLDNEHLQVDFKPLYECIHINSALDSLDEIRRSYQADRKAQSDLILPSILPLDQLPKVTEEVVGFFIIETHVLNTTGSFRSPREVEDLWDALLRRIGNAVDTALKNVSDADSYLGVKECLLSFIMTLEQYSYSTENLHAFILYIFGRYVSILEYKFGLRFEKIVAQDDCLPMYVENATQREDVLKTVWLTNEERDQLTKSQLPLTLPWSSGFYLCCQDIRSFVQKFYEFLEGVSQHHRNIDDLLSRTLDNILANFIASNVGKRIQSTSNLSQIVQIVANVEHLEIACTELERSLTLIRSSQRGGAIHITVASAFNTTLQAALSRVNASIASKLDDFFGLSEYDWTPPRREENPSMYLYELINWLTTVVDSLVIKDAYKDKAYRGAADYIAECFMGFLTGRNVPMINENGVANLVTDIDFLEDEFKKNGQAHLNAAFLELRLMSTIVLEDQVQQYLIPAVRQASYSVVRPRNLQSLLQKLAKWGAECKDAASRQRGEKRRKEAEAVGALVLADGR
ncbi:exocyst complex subunit Sec15-like protein [Daedalea quercina L-15889]|uniref:Exocyst complex component SEC15 n=1 Tax=Daedalea quercina L-15889 TaxID=1314783 RepID=A0A165SV80_9APHY|nr:exocyst complex subunit Sec15-like protein [Daedalea quercina L-15889]